MVFQNLANQNKFQLNKVHITQRVHGLYQFMILFNDQFNSSVIRKKMVIKSKSQIKITPASYRWNILRYRNFN